MNLPTYTWDQAAILGLATARGFGALGINAATVRKWASRNLPGTDTPAISASGKAPGGALLYPIDAVIRHAERKTSASAGQRSA